MKDCIGCENSSSTFSRCNPPISTDCVFYKGSTLECASDKTFTICKNSVMTEVQRIVFNKICALSASIDVSEIRFPCSLQTAWQSENPTLLNLLSYIVEVQCNQNELINTLTTNVENINPKVNVCLRCCDGDNCGSTELLLSEALNKIVECLCRALTLAEDASQTASNAFSQSTDAINLYNELMEKNCILIKQVAEIASYLNNQNLGTGISLSTTC